jgi:hypothetical protein
MKIISTIALIALTMTSFGQIKFYTDNGTVETTAIDASVEDVKLVIVIPDEASNHQAISIQYQSSPDDDERWNDYFWRKDLTPAFLEGKKTLDYWLKKPGEESGDFCIEDDCNKIFRAVDDDRRNYVAQPIRIKIYGKDFSKMIWENGEQKKKYQYTLLESADLQVDYGPIMSAVMTDGGMFQLSKFKGSDGYAEVFSNTGQVYLTSDLERNGGGVSFVFTEVEVGESSASSDPLEDIKLSIERSLFIVGNFRTKRYLPENPATSYGDEAISKAVYAPMLNTKGAGSNYPKEAKRFDKRAEYIDWKVGKLGNFEGQVLEIPVYRKSQLKSHEKTYRLKEEETGNTVPLKIFIGEADGKYFASTLAARGTEKLNEEELAFWNHIESTFKMN